MADFYSGYLAPPNGFAKYRLRLSVNVASQDVAANTSTVKWAMVLEKDRSQNGFYGYTSTFSASINGTGVWDQTVVRPSEAWTGWASHVLATGTLTITHDANGLKTIPVTATYTGANSGWSIGTVTTVGNLTMTLPAIPRATTPTVTPSPAVIGTGVVFALPRASAAYTHDLTWVSGNQSGTIGTALGDSATWTVPDVFKTGTVDEQFQSGAVELRTNLMLNPGWESGGSQGANIGSNTNVTTEALASAARTGTLGLRRTSTSDTSSAIGYGQNSATVQPGDYVASFYVRSNSTRGVNPYMEGTAGRTAQTTSGVVNFAPGVWTRIWFKLTVTTAGTLKPGFLPTSSFALGEYVDTDDFLLEVGTELRDPFDGSTPDSAAYDFAWTGTANASTSTATLKNKVGPNGAPIAITVVTKNGTTTLGTKQLTLFAKETATASAPEVMAPIKQFDVRARQVRWTTDSGRTEWAAREHLPASTIQLVDPLSSTATCSISMSKLNAIDFPDFSVIDIDTFDGDNWKFTNHRFVLSRNEQDDIDPARMATYTGTEYVDFMLQYAYFQDDYRWDGSEGTPGTEATDDAEATPPTPPGMQPTTPGEMMRGVIQDAQKRGWGPRIGITFDSNKTSLGEPWANANISRVFSKGTPGSQVLQSLVEEGLVEYRTEYRDNKAWLILLNPGTGSDYAADYASTVVNFGLAKLTRAPRRSTMEKRLTSVTVAGDEDVQITRTRTPFDADVFGVMEGWVSASGIKTNTEARRVGDAALRDNYKAVSERTFEYDAQSVASHFYPYQIFRTGDWVMIPDGDNNIKDRISQVTINKGADGTSLTLLTGDRILSGTASLAKRQAAQTGGSINGGSGMTSPTIDSRIPQAPVVSSVTSLGYWNTDGAAKSTVTVSWARVTQAVNSASLTVTIYEVWWRPTGVDGDWSLRGTTDKLTIKLSGWDVLVNLDFRVRARSKAGVWGEFSENQVGHTTLAPAVDLAGPIITDLYSDSIGSIYVVWAGVLGVDPAPARMAYVTAEVSGNGGSTYSNAGNPISAAGTIIIPVTPGDYLVRLRPYDRLGNPGTPSAAQPITMTDPHLNEVVSLYATSQVLVVPAAGGATVPATTTVTGTGRNATITVWEYSVDGAAFSATVPAGVSRTGNVVTITGATMTARTIAVRMADAYDASDTLTVAKVVDGATGADGSDGTNGTNGTNGVGISTTVVNYVKSSSGTVTPSTGWGTSIPTTVAGEFLWTRTVTTYTNATTSTAYSVAAHGATGLTGAPGKGVSSTAITYQSSASGTTAPTGTWLASPPAVAAGQYLWTRTVLTYTDATTATAYSVGRMGTDGSNGTAGTDGTDGAAGADGQTSYLHVAYATNATGTTGFSTTDPSGKTYIGTYTDFTLADSTNAALYTWALIKGADGADGIDGATGPTGKGISSSAITYQVSSSGTVVPTGTWLSSVPSTTAGQFLWTRTVISFTDGATSTAYSVAVHGTTGSTGATGVGVSGTVVNYSKSTSGTTAPTTGWGTAIPTTVTGEFLWTRTVTTYTNATTSTGYSVAAHGATGSPGTNGTNGTDGYTVLLSNESHTFSGTTQAAVAGSTTSTVIAYKGATAIAAFIGTITGQVTGLTTAITGNSTTAATITVTVTDELVAQAGVLTVPLTIDGKSFTKTFSWTVARSTVGVAAPVPPTLFAAVAGAAWDASGFFPEAWFDLTWVAPTLDTEGQPTEIVGYDVLGIGAGDAVERVVTSTSGAATAVRLKVGIGETWTLRVRAASNFGGLSEPSTDVTLTANATVAPSAAPTAPTLDQYAGLLRIKWAGGGMAPHVKYAYASISSTLGGIYSRAGMPLTGAGEVVVPGLAPGAYYAKIVLVDELGTESPSVASDPITLLPITGVTVQTSELANTGIKLTSGSLTSYDVSGNPTFILNAASGEVWIAPYDAVFNLGATGTVATTGAAATGIAVSSENSSFNTFIHSAGLQIRNDQTALSWWEADALDASLVNFFSPRAVIGQRMLVGDFEMLKEAKATGSRLVIRYKGA